MSKKKEQFRDYKFSDAKLKQLADGIIQNIDRDQVEFSTKGFTPAKKQFITDLINQLDNQPVDELLKGKKITKTEEKDALRGEIEKMIRSIMVMVENKYSKESGKYKQFGVQNTGRMSDEHLLRISRNVALSGTELIGELQTEGLTQKFLDEFTAKIVSFDKAIDKKLEAVRNREIATENRIIIGNKLYNEIIKLCNTGKDIWYSEHEAKYNDYIINDTPSGEAKPELSEPVSEAVNTESADILKRNEFAEKTNGTTK